jgi:hypothetical protein
MPLVFYGRSSSATQESGVAVAIAVDVAPSVNPANPALSTAAG